MEAFEPNNNRENNLKRIRNAIGSAWLESKTPDLSELKKMVEALTVPDLIGAFRKTMTLQKTSDSGGIKSLAIVPFQTVTICFQLLEALSVGVLMEAVRAHITELYTETVDIKKARDSLEWGVPTTNLLPPSTTPSEIEEISSMSLLYFMEIDDELFIDWTDRILELIEGDLRGLLRDLSDFSRYVVQHKDKIRSLNRIDPNPTTEEYQAHKMILDLYSLSNQLTYEFRVTIPAKAMGSLARRISMLDQSNTLIPRLQNDLKLGGVGGNTTMMSSRELYEALKKLRGSTNSRLKREDRLQKIMSELKKMRNDVQTMFD